MHRGLLRSILRTVELNVAKNHQEFNCLVVFILFHIIKKGGVNMEKCIMCDTEMLPIEGAVASEGDSLFRCPKCGCECW